MKDMGSLSLSARFTHLWVWQQLVQWLKNHGIKVRAFLDGPQTKREVILVTAQAASAGAEVFRNLAGHIARGSTAIYLSPIGQIPLKNKGAVAGMPSWLYHKDEWCKRHPIFDGLQSGCLMDYTFYREIIPGSAWLGQEVPAEVVAGAINTSIDYSAGLFVAVHKLGAGRFVLNTLLIRENIMHSPVAERLLRNMLIYGAADLEKPLAELPMDFDAQLKEMGM